MSTDVVAKLDAWLKEHHRQAHEDYLESVADDIAGIINELERVEPLVNELVGKLDPEVDPDDLFALPADLEACTRGLEEQIQRIDLALDAQERAS